MAQSGNPALQPDHLHRCARLWGRCFWGEQYPDEEVLDDIENYRALELLHAGFCLRHRTWKALIESAAGTAESAEPLFREILNIREVSIDNTPDSWGGLTDCELEILRPFHHREICG